MRILKILYFYYYLITYSSSLTVVKCIWTEFHVRPLSERYALRICQTTKHCSFTTVMEN